MEIKLSIPDSVCRDLEECAATKAMSVSEFILSEILLYARGCFIHCEKCSKVLTDEREILTGMGSKYSITCECGNVMEAVRASPSFFEDEE